MFRISTKTHGLLDYFVGATIAALPRMLNCNKSAARVLQAAGVGAAAYSMLAGCERGIVKALPMEGHLTRGALSGASLMAGAVLLKDDTPPNRAIRAGLGA